jgi:predicted TIM-barrel fold metal-dependent hydrolase
MIIDSHVHLIGEGWGHPSLALGTARITAAALCRKTGDCLDAHELAKRSIPLIADPTAEKLVAAMDQAGVDQSCIFSVDFGLLTGEPQVSIIEQNRLVAEAAERFPGRLIPYFTIDPRRPEAVDSFCRAVEEWGMKGLKLHPTSGYYACDEACYPLYEKCVEYDLPVLIHAGGINAPLKARFALPMYVDDVAADFPELPIIIAHVGMALWNEALHVASMKPNVYFDFSAWQMAFNFYPQDFYRMLRRVINTVGPWRVFFGTDTPMLSMVCSLERWVTAIKEPDFSSCPEIYLKEDEKEIILGKAFAKMMKLS